MFLAVPAPVALAVALTAFIAGCGGSSGPVADRETSGTISGQVFKGPTSGASVCVFNVTSGSKGLQVAATAGSAPSVVNGCVLTAADGTYSFVLPTGTRGDLLLESTGGTYCSDESVFNGTSCAGGGTPVTMGTNVLSTLVAAPSSGTVNAPLTLLTSAAVQATTSLSSTTFAASYGTIAAGFNAPADPATAPTTGALAAVLANLATFVGTSTGDLQEILSGIAAGTLTAANTTFPVGVEFAVASDQLLAHLYTVGTDGATLVSTARLPGIPGSYSRSGSTVTVTMPGHGIRDGLQVPLTFATGTGGSATSGTYKATVVDENTFTVEDSNAGAISNGTLYRNPVAQLAGTYQQVSGQTRVTVSIPDHGLSSGNTVDLRMTSGGGTNVSAPIRNVVDANTLEVELPAAATTNAAGNLELSFGKNYASFDVTMHPSGKWLYVASGYDCPQGTPYCWGGDVISTFRIDWQRGKLTFVTANRTGSTGSSAVPVKMALNAAGTRMVHQDDDLDGLVLWSVDPDTGAIARIADSGSNTTSYHGVAFSGDSQFVYSGGRVFTVASSAITLTNSSVSGGNGGDIVGDALFYTVPSRRGGGQLLAYSLATPSAPSLLGSITSITDRDVTTRNGSTLVAAGFGGIKSYSFSGSTLAAAAPANGSAELQRDGTATLGNDSIMYRSVHMNAAGNMAVASYFTNTVQSGFGAKPSGYLFAKVGADGALARISDAPIAEYARVAKFIKQK